MVKWKKKGKYINCALIIPLKFQQIQELRQWQWPYPFFEESFVWQRLTLTRKHTQARTQYNHILKNML